MVTGFGPFGGFETNPSQLVVQQLVDGDWGLNGVRLITDILPVAYDVVYTKVKQLWTDNQPDVSSSCRRRLSTQWVT